MQDPPVPDWASMQLPDSWADQLRLWRPWDLLRLLRRSLSKRARVQLPHDMPGRDLLPKYLLQEFHHLPNGNYSKQFTHGYIKGFDRMMIGTMNHARLQLAKNLRGCNSALDVGTAGGHMAAALKAQGVPDVWALDPSPYLLQHAARRYPQVNFVQGTAEDTPFSDARFEGITSCFVLHELPPRQGQAALRELARVIKPGGLLAICEPGAAQLEEDISQLWQKHGLRGVYFSALARLVHEPFVRAWHKINLPQALDAAGFYCISDAEQFPVRFVLAKRKM